MGQAIGDAGNPGRDGAVVRLYLDNGNGVPDAGDALTSTATTAAGGAFVLTPGAAGTYWVVADSKLVTPSAGIKVGFTQGDVWAEQTWGAAGTRCSDGAGGTVERGTAGACYGGRAGSLSDNATGLNTPEHVTRLVFSGSAIPGVNLGFSFNVVTNELAGNASDDDVLANRTVQGSLRQFLQNANAINGANPMRFVPATATNTSAGGGSWWRISFSVALPALTDPGTTIDGRAYAFADGVTVRDQNPGVLGAGGTVGVDALALAQAARPEMEIIDVSTLLAGIDVRANAVMMRRIAIWGFGTLPSTAGHANITVADGVTGTLIEENIIGGGASSFSGQVFASAANIRSEGADLGIVRNNLIGFSSSEGFHGAAGTTGWTIEGNEIRVNPNGGYLFGNGIDIGSAGSGGFTIRGNLITQHSGPDIETAGGTGGSTIVNNTLTQGGTAGGFDSGLRLDGAGNVVDRNVIRDNSGAGVLVMSGSTGNTITRNSMLANGKTGIDLLSATDSQSTGTAPFVTPNDAGDGDAGGNGLLNFPVLLSGVVSGGLVVGTFSLDVVAGSYRVEFFKNPLGADLSGNGEGQIFAGSTDVAHIGGGSRFFAYSIAGVAGDIVTATATECTDGAVHRVWEHVGVWECAPGGDDGGEADVVRGGGVGRGGGASVADGLGAGQPGFPCVPRPFGGRSVDAVERVADPGPGLVADRAELHVARRRPRERGDVLLPVGGRGHGVGVDVPRAGFGHAGRGRRAASFGRWRRWFGRCGGCGVPVVGAGISWDGVLAGGLHEARGSGGGVSRRAVSGCGWGDAGAADGRLLGGPHGVGWR